MTSEWLGKMASLVGLGTKEGEKRAADLAPLTQPIPKGTEKKMEELEALSSRRGETQIHARYRESPLGPIRDLIEGEEYERVGDTIRLLFEPKIGAYLGVRRTGENELGVFDHTTWYPSVRKAKKKK